MTDADRAVSAPRAQDDLFAHVNGEWLATATIPDDKPSAGAFDELRDGAEEAVRDIILGLGEQADTSDHGAARTEAGQIADLYASFTDTDRIEQLGTAPLTEPLAQVDAVTSAAELLELTARLNRESISGLIGFDSEVDPGNPQRVVLFVGQGGIGLPDEEYYREDSYATIREQYRDHIAASFTLAGLAEPQAQAEAVLGLETEIAALHWDKVRRRDMQQMYNLMTADELAASAPGLDWDRFWAGSQIPAEARTELVVMQPSFLTEVAALLTDARLAQWQSWARWRVISSLASYLPQAFVDEQFAFYGTTLSGTPTLRPRWKRGVDLVEGALGEAVGKLYVEQHFSPKAKERMDELVANLIAAYGESIRNLDWMTEQTKAKALDKLGKFTPKIGYPAKWRDYSDLEIRADDLIGNVRRATAFELDWQLSKIGKPADPDEWLMTPQTVNAYYHPLRNEIVFPAAILQPPFFSEDASDAVNYGGIGAVIGHEIGHGFDDQGSTCDGDGRLIDWWTDEDREAFTARTKALIDQYSALESPQNPGNFVNGDLTIGENIGDLGGLGIAIKAYRLSRGGSASDEDLRAMFVSWATVWRYVARDEHALRRLATDPHSPPVFRCNQVVRNLDEFHRVFDVTESDALWLDPADRVTIW
ncbi:MAG TPA: peptidase M13 [Candidatus Avipropionibacterium avicola]|uniref:Peptidase M13 n=1 Tax=Candidatus Avipropionibacterium avicola TaxID=2840701 RepID=A0A9D1KL69_9ACTN|nr:peptidase M13 [Candidatus Avipropionibacterium avicola]